MFDVVGIEMPCIDLNVNIDEFPQPNFIAMINQLSWQGGGKVASGIVAAARLGAECSILGGLGDDIYGRFCLNDFQRHGIETERMLLCQNETTSLSIVLSDMKTKNRTFLYRLGSVKPFQIEEQDKDKIRASKYLFIASTYNLYREAEKIVEEAVKTAMEAGTKVFMDADYYSAKLMELIPNIDVFIASEYVYYAIFPEGKSKSMENMKPECEKVFTMGPEIVVFTFGEKGCIGYSKEGFFTLPAFKIDAVDTVGAGDVFHGGFLAALLKGRSVKECARFASAVAAIKCTRIGGRAGIPDEKTVEQFLKDGTIDYTEINERVKYYQNGIV